MALQIFGATSYEVLQNPVVFLCVVCLGFLLLLLSYSQLLSELLRRFQLNIQQKHA